MISTALPSNAFPAGHPSLNKVMCHDRFVVDTVKIQQELVALHLDERLASSKKLFIPPTLSVLRTRLDGGSKSILPASSLSNGPVGFSSNFAIPPNPPPNLPFSAPERVLDAPGIIDDFYLNILDWSVRNVLAIALGSSVYLWNGADGSVCELVSLPPPSSSTEPSHIASLSWMHDGKAVAVGTSQGLVQIWDVERQRKLRTILAGGSRVSSLSWNRHLLSAGSRDGSVMTHDVRIANSLQICHEAASMEVCGMAWSPDGRQLAAGSNDNTIRIWQLGDGDQSKPLHLLRGHSAAVKAVAWCPWRSSLLATGGGSQDRSIRVWNTSLGGESVEHVQANAQISALKWSPLGQELISAHGNGRNHLAMWRCNSAGRNFELVGELAQAHDARILHMAISPDGKSVATAAADESIKFWNCFARKSNCLSSSKKISATASESNSKESPFSLKTRAR